jgi:3-hydroxyacyl-[acyl-carrier-protein] dehydratase
MTGPLPWNTEKICTILPQRIPFLFVDKVIAVDGTRQVTAIKQVTENEYFFKGHFPGNPVMPGVIITEALAQTAIILYHVCKPEISKRHPAYYLGKAKSEFLAPVRPGDTLTLEANNVKITDTAGVVEGIARVKDTVVAKAEFVFGIKPHE